MMYYSMDKTQQTAGDNSATKTTRDGECCLWWREFIFIKNYIYIENVTKTIYLCLVQIF